MDARVELLLRCSFHDDPTRLDKYELAAETASRHPSTSSDTPCPFHPAAIYTAPQLACIRLIILHYIHFYAPAAICSGWMAGATTVPLRGLSVARVIAFSSSSAEKGSLWGDEGGRPAVMVLSIRSSGIFRRSAVEGLSAAVAV